MRAYLMRRLLLVIPTLLILSLNVFLTVRLLPGDVIDAMLTDLQYSAGDVDREALERMLGLVAIVIGLLIALPVGIYTAIRQDTVADYLGRSLAIIGLTTPNFWLGVMVIIYPTIWWDWTPPMFVIPFTEDPLGSLGVFVIPGLILGTYYSAATMRMTRTMMLEVLRQD